MNDRQKQYAAEAALIFAMFTWGITFTVVKEVVRTIPVHWFHTLRFSIGAAALWGLLVFSPAGSNRSAPRFGWYSIGAGILLGVVIFASYACQTFGLVTTTASKSALITGTAVLWVPFLMIVVMHVAVERRALLTGIAGLTGLFLLVMDNGWTSFWKDGLVTGDVLTIFCALAVAIHLLLTKRYSHRYDTTTLTAVQISMVAVLSLISSVVCQESWSFAYSFKTYMTIAFLGLITTALNFWILTRAQRYTTSQRVAVLFLFEPLFAAATGWFILGEYLAIHQWCGAALILGAVFMLEAQTSNKSAQ